MFRVRLPPFSNWVRGFNPDFSGRENIFINAAVLGLSHRQTQDRMDQILDFAEIGEFIDQPVKTYSSGMFVRLAFAVAVHVDPEILLVDEALAVGDLVFQHRCIHRMRQPQRRRENHRSGDSRSSCGDQLLF